jgi:hypothetical protein
MRRTVCSLAFVAVVGALAGACANSSTPDSGGASGKTDASLDEASAGYDSGYAPVTEDAGPEDAGAPADSSRKEASTDAGTQRDTGSTSAGACDPANISYDFVFAALLLSGGPLPPDCASGCASTECCYDSGAGMYCLAQ